MPPPGNYSTRNSQKSQQEEAAVNIVTVSCDSGGKRDYARYVDIVAVSCDSSEMTEEPPAGSITVTQTGATEGASEDAERRWHGESELLRPKDAA